MTFHFNFYDIEFLYNKAKILEDFDTPVIIDNNLIGDNYLVAHWRKKR